ncbi:condensin complex component cnd1 [Tothia fuscella]|uniref:Condensin complex subunit 1 n=1 Tax=Tothia fuscella TaxID=1048955 RepID=A0A9P4NEJ2_9PEZI|nr:condensin complex component cnd1 [Tothia fuscella]
MMDERIDFDINDALKQYLSDPSTISTPEAPSDLIDCEQNPDDLTAALVNSALNPVVDSVAENPDAITRRINFDTLQILLKSASCLPPQSLSKILDLVVSSLSVEADLANADLDADEQEAVAHHKHLLEVFGFLLQWAVAAVETKAAEKSASSTVGRGRGGKGVKKGSNKDGSWDSAPQLQTALDVMSKVLKLKLARIFVTTSERDTFISLFTRPVYLVLESEVRVKSQAIRMHTFRLLCIAIKHHGHAYAAQTAIVQNLTYFEHLSEPMAEFLQILSEQYDYPQLAEDVLRELSNKEFNSNDTKGPKSVSTFVAKLSELAPRIVIKQMTSVAKFMDSESYTLRCAIIEVCGNLIAMLSKEEDNERSENHKAQINVFFDVLEERFLDLNPYCRCRTIQVYVKLCDLDTKFPKRRQTVAELATRSLEDKSSNVRRNAIKLLGKLVQTHPFAVLHGGLLSHKDWNGRLEAVETQVNALKPPEELREKEPGEHTVDTQLLDDATVVDNGASQPAAEMTDEEKQTAHEKAQAEAQTAEALNKLQLTRRYYLEALKFIEVLHEASPIVTQLLSSKNKSEIIEAMDFFVMLDAYKIETARIGIRRMLRLIWTKGNSDEGKGVQTHLIESYKGLFFDAPDSFTGNDAANYVARNMISLTFGATPAELTSLEQLLSTMMKQELVNDAVVQKLWAVYGVQVKEISKNQRRGAIIVLGMLALAEPDIVVKEMEVCLRIGLGELGRRDLGLARYTCIALQRINTAGKKNEKSKQMGRLPNDHAVLVRLAAMAEMVSSSKEWFGVAEQAIGAIYALAKHPDTLCSDVLRRKTKHVFSPKVQARRLSDVSMTDADMAPTEPTPPTEEVADKESDEEKPASALSQLLFIVGHIAIKQIVHLELCEQDFKRRKAEKEAKTGGSKTPHKSMSVAPSEPPTTAGRKKTKGKSSDSAPAEDVDELDLMAGTTEDDFQEAIQHIRERELLYGQTSLLSSFGPLVHEICANNTTYADPTLQSQAALCMAKLMCVSSEYCESNLSLLITILERSTNAIVRSNLVVALGDMAVCFNHLIDENTDFLYRRLSDGDVSVRRTCLMTLTFLILAGQVKVKGQLGEMAKCTEDGDKILRDMSRMFFTELATKDNAVYNHFVDMFSLLSADGGLEEEGFRRIIKFLLGFIEKDKHAKQLANKLAARLGRCDSERQWNDVAFALGALQHKDEEISKVLAEGFKVVQVQG